MNISNRLASLLSSLKKKTFSIHSLGCRTNQAEILQLAAWLENLRFKSSNKNPGIVLINTCAVTQKGFAESKRLIKNLKEKFPESKVIAIGCAVNYAPDQFSPADLIISNKEKEILLKKHPCPYSKNILHPFSRSGRFFLRIQSGCNNFCTYCIVPHLRRKIIDLSPKKAVEQIKQAEKLGHKEVVLTGTNLNLYGKGNKYNLTDLVKAILAQTTIPRISFGSINLGALDKNLISLLQKSWQKKRPRISRYLHIPLQSGSDRILKRMNRPYVVQQFEKVVKKLTNKNPLVGIGTDVIVGFPGETKKEFQQTVSFIKRMPFSRLHIFRYNPREGTVAIKKEKEWGSVNEEEKKRRAKIIRQIEKNKQKEFYKKIKGARLPVLFLEEITGNKQCFVSDKNKWRGLTDSYVSISKACPPDGGLNKNSKKSLQGKIMIVKII